MTPTTWTAIFSSPPSRPSRPGGNWLKQIFNHLPPISEWHYLALALGALIVMSYSCNDAKPLMSLPIHVSMRQSALNSANGVLQIENRSDETLHLALAVENLDTGQELTVTLEPLPPRKAVELGILELNWTFVPNEEITVMDLKAPQGTLRANRFNTFRTAEGIIGIREQ